jgi:redox-sensitive bicupin YhaK (pirin superfamily)
MKTIYHSADSRGHAEHGWLTARHSFSFANYYDPERVHFGKLRVLNDDIVAPGQGFDTHPHNNMEIITIPLQGSLEHKDSMGNGSVITSGEVQVMSAGSGVLHSEFNPSSAEEVNLLQIWIFPEKRDVEPRYDQRRFDPDSFKGNIKTIVNNNENDNSLFIHQKAVLSLSQLAKGESADYQLHHPGHGVYVFVIEGKANLAGQQLLRRDALGVSETDTFRIESMDDCFILFLEVPMN